MIAILTGDIIDSRGADPKVWMPILEAALKQYSVKYDIFRGDSFQAEMALMDVFTAVFYIKAALIRVKLDARIGVGIGERGLEAKHVKHSFGTALLNSGEAFENLKRNSLLLKSTSEEFDEMCNVMLSLTTELTSRWTINMAELVMTALQHQEMSQMDMAKLLNRRYQSQISTGLQKAAYPKLKRAIDYCTRELLKL